jgi:hypothetical protein
VKANDWFCIGRVDCFLNLVSELAGSRKACDNPAGHDAATARPPPRRLHRRPSARKDLTQMAADVRCARGADCTEAVSPHHAGHGSFLWGTPSGHYEASGVPGTARVRLARSTRRKERRTQISQISRIYTEATTGSFVKSVNLRNLRNLVRQEVSPCLVICKVITM